MSGKLGRSDGDETDLLIVGGGINGAGIARDAAGRGLRVTLLEQFDLASATSSASSKLIHGGLRYLETFEFRLVRESLMERERLLAIAPHLIRPMEFILPHVPHLRPRWQIRAGLFLYDHLGERRKLPASRAVRIDGDRYGPLQPGLQHGFAYADCWVDDSRLVVANALDAAERGARILTRTRFLSATGRDGQWIASCQSSHGKFEIRARALVNACGPWVERTLHDVAGVESRSQVRLVQGSHIIVPALYSGPHAFLLQNPDDRVVFAIPYEGKYTVVGTTDVPFDGDPARVRISDAEIEYLCSTVNRYFRSSLSPSEVHATYAGVRPLLEDETKNVSKVTRDYRLELARHESGAPLLSVFGGKITTYRRLAESALEKLAEPFGRTRNWTEGQALPGGDIPAGDFDSFAREVSQRWAFLPPETALRMAHAYGTRMERILGSSRAMSDLGEDFGHGLTEAELEYLVVNEWARSAQDVLHRRTKLGLDFSRSQADRLESAMSASLGATG